MSLTKNSIVWGVFLGSMALTNMLVAESRQYPLEVFPAEHKHMTDEKTGVALTFLTTSESRDINLYFHDQSWLADGSLILFTSNRERGGVMGYLTDTGELVRIATPEGRTNGPTAARQRNSVFVLQENNVLELALDIAPADTPDGGASTVIATERRIATIPQSGRRTALNESSDGKWLSVGLSDFEDGSGPLILIINVATGEIRELCRLPEPPGYGYHVQWSLTNPNLLSFASHSEDDTDFAGPPRPNKGPTDYRNRRQRIWVVDIRNGIPHNVYHALEGELVTHESWWVDDQILFSGGTRSDPPVEQHVKLLNIYTGQVRIIGAGAWWPDGQPETLAKWSWWHASGSEDGRWVAADNFHGDIMLFEGNTTRPHLLTQGHRVYGRGPHLHVGWDRKGEQVVFTSDKLGPANVCIATIPEALQQLVENNTDGLGAVQKDNQTADMDNDAMGTRELCTHEH